MNETARIIFPVFVLKKKAAFNFESGFFDFLGRLFSVGKFKF